jgi:isohexenylglutaconyl-CoA hydratase
MPQLPDTETLALEFESGWLRIWLDRPQTRNALSGEMVAELTAVLNAVREDRSVRGITLRGRGGVFCAGGDLKSFGSMLSGSEPARPDGEPDPARIEEVARFSRGAGELFGMLDTVPQVLLVLVEGAAMAGGLGVTCTADVVAVTRDAKFALTETTLGIAPAQIAPFVVNRIGLPAARRLMLTAARFDGTEAGRIGLADHVVDDAAALDAVEAKVREQVLRCAPAANAVTKELIMATRTANREQMLDLAGRGFARCLLSAEGREGITAFLEKRKPAWAE